MYREDMGNGGGYRGKSQTEETSTLNRLTLLLFTVRTTPVLPYSLRLSYFLLHTRVYIGSPKSQ